MKLVALAAGIGLLTYRCGWLVGLLGTFVVVVPTIGPAIVKVYLWDKVSLAAMIVTAGLVIGGALHVRRTAGEQLSEQRQTTVQAQEGQILLTERARIARELHDVVAHHMSMVAVRAETAPYRLTDLPETARAEFIDIGAAARAALTDMRQLLGVLRDGAPADLAPQPGVGQIPDLVSAMAASGARITHEVDGPPVDLPAAVDLAAYRIVQEALSNAGRHAPGAEIAVRLGYLPTAVVVTISNGPAVVAERTGTALTVRLPDASAQPHGLVGMRERVTLAGGTLLAYPAPGGGFVVEVTMPYGGTETVG
ncbi:sensor histidine kinase [Fodinicola feengrottensis]|uniref:sensor histidine kinase n=1 Tax=Fodinicola feengrottensis TaxID=435914 RepID=UPI0013CF4399|nr:histidine kinase [Fodinicola feengrottensis]